MDKTEAVYDAVVGAVEEYLLVSRKWVEQVRRLAPLPHPPAVMRDADFAVSRVKASLYNALEANRRGDPDDATIAFAQAATAQSAQALELVGKLANIHVASTKQPYANPSPAVLGTPANPAKEQPVV